MILMFLLQTFKFAYSLFRWRLNKRIDRWNYTRTYLLSFHFHSIQYLFILRRFLPLMLFSRFLQGIVSLHRRNLLDIYEWRMGIAFGICASVLTINLYFIRLQTEKVVLNHLSVKDVWNLFCIFYYFVKKIVVSGFSWGCFILLQINDIFILLLVYQILRLSWNG